MKEKILNLRKMGFSFRKISKELNCSISTVSYHCKKCGLNTPLKQPNKLSNELILKIKNENPNQLINDIAKKYNVSIWSIKKYNKNFKLTFKIQYKKRKTYYKICLYCNNEFQTKNNETKCCSLKCARNLEYQTRIINWKNGNHNGMRGTTSTVKWIKRYLIEKYGEKCMECGWSEKNPYTNNIPIELEHIDGNFRNNNEDNLKLLCPNCHSLTPTYKGANKNGRPRSKYY